MGAGPGSMSGTHDPTGARLDRALARWAVAADGCLIWTGAAVKPGPAKSRYPYVRIGGRTYYVRRLIWVRDHGPIPKGMTVRSTCGRDCCVAPEHLALGSPGRRPEDRARPRKAAPDRPAPPPRVCPECGRVFLPSSGGRALCGEECRLVRSRRLDRERKRRERGALVTDFSRVIDPSGLRFADPERAGEAVARGICPLCGQPCRSLHRHLAGAHGLSRADLERALEV